MKSGLLGGMAALLALAGGCIDARTVVFVNGDGGGTVTETVFPTRAAEEMITAMLAGLGGPAATAEPALDIRQYRTRAAGMGDGVRVISVARVRRASGRKGERAIYGFQDVRKLKLNPGPRSPGLPAPERPDAAPPGSEGLRFGFEPAPGRKLAISLPPARDRAAGESREVSGLEPPAAEPPAETAEDLAQMRALFEGMRVRLLVKVDGRIKTTNASYVQVEGETGRTNTVTLFDLDFGRLLADPDGLRRLQGMAGARDMGTAMRLVKGVPGVRIETANPVEIEF